VTIGAVGDDRLFDALDRHARSRPTGTAVEGAGSASTYAEIGDRSRELALRLVRSGVKPGDRVAILASKCPRVVAAIYGCLRAGAAYVPIGADWPLERRRWVVANVGAAALLVDDEHRDEPVPPETRSIPLAAIEAERDAASEAERRELDERSAGVDPASLSYVLFTSGSTGDPKGVMHSHRSALAFVRWAVNELELCSEDRLASHAPFHFDLSILDLFAAAAAGAAVVLPGADDAAAPRRYAAWLNEAGITISYSVPGIWIPVLAQPGLGGTEGSSLRRIVYAGEPMAPQHVLALQERFPRAVVHNFYGPTETNVCTSYRVPRLSRDTLPGAIPIGTACSGDEVHVEDDELVVTGESVFMGYWGKQPRPQVEPYRTGDVVRWDDERHGYVFVGRRDGMRKVRGYRIELQEIEACVLRSAKASEVVATVDLRDAAHPTVVAFVVPSEGAAHDTMSLKRHCAQYLPPYMVPRILWRDVLPRTSTGKVDRRALEAELSSH